MLQEDWQRQRLGEEITRVELGVDVLDVQLPLKAQLTHLEVATIDMARTVTRLAVP